MNVSADRRYTREHEWLRDDGDLVVVGITDYAASHLGDIVFVELPRPGARVAQFAPIGAVESVKAVSDLFAPVSGEVVATNEALTGQPELLNTDPYGDGWIARLRVDDRSELDALLDAEAYEAFTKE